MNYHNKTTKQNSLGLIRRGMLLLLLAWGLAHTVTATPKGLFLVDPIGDGTDKGGFISLSEVLRLAESESNWLVTKAWHKNPRDPFIHLTKGYRAEVLKRAGLSEADTLYLYDYEMGKLKRHAISNIQTYAQLNIYTNLDDCPCPLYYYQIGFKLEASDLEGVNQYKQYVTVAFGKANPFVVGGLRPVIWKKVSNEAAPKAIRTLDIPDGQTSETYKATIEKDVIWVQQLGLMQEQAGFDIQKVRVILLKPGDNSVMRTWEFKQSESEYPYPLNGAKGLDASAKLQWAGKLLVNEPPVIFGFSSMSFGCNSIHFLDKEKPDAYWLCDNRH